MVSVGFGSNKKTRHCLPDGFKKFLIHNKAELEVRTMAAALCALSRETCSHLPCLESTAPNPRAWLTAVDVFGLAVADKLVARGRCYVASRSC